MQEHNTLFGFSLPTIISAIQRQNARLVKCGVEHKHIDLCMNVVRIPRDRSSFFLECVCVCVLCMYGFVLTKKINHQMVDF